MQVKTVIVPPKKILCEQLFEEFWEEYAEIITGSKQEITKDIVIMTWATFNKRYDEINWKFAMLLFDECHRMPQKRRDQILMRKWTHILWLTATLQRKEFGSEWFEMFYWKPITTNKEALPMVIYQKRSKRDYTIEEYERASEWLSPDSPEILRRLIIDNEKRNLMIAELVNKCLEKWLKRIIIFTDRTQHIKNITSSLSSTIDSSIPVYEYHWSSNQTQIKDLCNKSDQYILVWNVSCCWEWFNVPGLQIGLLTVSTQWTVTIDQAVGRVRRKHLNKKFGLLIDMQDSITVAWSKSKPLWFSQRRKIYKEKWRNVKDLIL
jgi:superfamily II DNA or RNA helicase